MRLMLFSCTLLLSLMLTHSITLQAQDLNPVVASLSTLEDLTVRGDNQNATNTASMHFIETLDKASRDQIREAIPAILSSLDNPNAGVRGIALLGVAASITV